MVEVVRGWDCLLCSLDGVKLDRSLQKPQTGEPLCLVMLSLVKVSADRGVTNSALIYCLLKHWVNADITAFSQGILNIYPVCLLFGQTFETPQRMKLGSAQPSSIKLSWLMLIIFLSFNSLTDNKKLQPFHCFIQE